MHSTLSAKPSAQKPFEAVDGRYTISTDPDRLASSAVYAYITHSYWARGRSYETVVCSLQHSLCFGLYHDSEQIGLTRLITDYATYAYLCDVYVLEEHQGKGLGKWLIDSALTHPELQTVRYWTLATRDAHEFYSAYGFEALSDPNKHMELIRPYTA